MKDEPKAEVKVTKKKRLRKPKKRDDGENPIYNALYKSVKQNLIAILANFYALYAFTQCKHNKSNLFLCILSMLFITYWGYYIHYLSHRIKFKFSKKYSKYDNAFTRNPYCNWLFCRLIDIVEFHHRTHHDSTINKSPKNIAFEFINNLIMQGGLILLLKYLLNLIDNRVILLWAMLYASAHNINYNIISPLTHQQHHLDDRTNYGYDPWDVIMGTKYDINDIEIVNHTAINTLVITAVIVYISNKYSL
jgi:hypothetical protein